MGKITLSDELKKKIAEFTGLTYLASNIEKFDDSEGEQVNEIINYFCPQQEMLKIVNTELKPEIMKEVPGLELDIEVPGEGGLTPSEPVTEQVTITIATNPGEAKVTINDEERTTITVDKGTEIHYIVELEGYKTVDETVSATETKVIEVNLEAEEPKVEPTIVSNAPEEIHVNENVEYTVRTTPGSYEGEMIYVEVDAGIEKEKINKVEYYEVQDETWKDLPTTEDGKYYFGAPSVGFPLMDAESRFRININSTGEYTTTMKVLKVSDKSVMCQASSTIRVIDAVVTETEQPVVETVAEQPVATQSKSRSKK